MIASYSEAAFFDGYHVHHVAAWEERNRTLRAERETRAWIMGRRKLAALQADVREVQDRASAAIKAYGNG